MKWQLMTSWYGSSSAIPSSEIAFQWVCPCSSRLHWNYNWMYLPTVGGDRFDRGGGWWNLSPATEGLFWWNPLFILCHSGRTNSLCVADTQYIKFSHCLWTDAPLCPNPLEWENKTGSLVSLLLSVNRQILTTYTCTCWHQLVWLLNELYAEFITWWQFVVAGGVCWIGSTHGGLHSPSDTSLA